MYIFEIEPVGKPRMTQRDKWLNPPRKPVAQYWAFKDELGLKANLKQFRIGTVIDLIFFIKMPESWSKAKKEQMYGMPHQSKPDADNLLKAFCDALSVADEVIWEKRVRKFWAEKSSIVVLRNDGEVRRLQDIEILGEIQRIP